MDKDPLIITSNLKFQIFFKFQNFLKLTFSDKFPGLKWMNTEKTIFRIPWKHAGKFSWREEDCLIFKVS